MSSTIPPDPTTASLERAAGLSPAAAAPGRLSVKWSKRERDLLYDAPRGPDGHLIHCWLHHTRWVTALSLKDALSRQGVLVETSAIISALAEAESKTLAEELTSRGYDLTTLRFQIDPKKP